MTGVADIKCLNIARVDPAVVWASGILVCSPTESSCSFCLWLGANNGKPFQRRSGIDQGLASQSTACLTAKLFDGADHVDH